MLYPYKSVSVALFRYIYDTHISGFYYSNFALFTYLSMGTFFIIWLQCSIYLFVSFLWPMNTFYHLTISIIIKLVICKKNHINALEVGVCGAYCIHACTLCPIIRNDKLLIQLIIRYSDVSTACKQYWKCTTNERMNVINEWQTAYC